MVKGVVGVTFDAHKLTRHHVRAHEHSGPRSASLHPAFTSAPGGYLAHLDSGTITSHLLPC